MSSPERVDALVLGSGQEASCSRGRWRGLASNSAVHGITRALAKELGPSEFERQAVRQTPLGRVGQPADIAAVAVFLASDDARWLTGEILFASGGL